MHVRLELAPKAALQVPLGQGSKVMLALAAPTVAQKPPGAHAWQLEAPGVLLNEPASQLSQLVAPGKALYLPTPQSEHIQSGCLLNVDTQALRVTCQFHKIIHNN